jgi:hypothetical protein
MAKTIQATPVAPVPVRGILLLLLPLIATVIYWDGRHYDSDLLDFSSQKEQLRQSAALFLPDIDGLKQFGQVRYYNRDTLYEYINGHAEFFLSAGFQSLAVGEYAAPGANAPALVVNLYDMGKGLHAFGVLIDEASAGEAVNIGTMGFASAQGVNFIQGNYYAQITLFDPQLPLLDNAQRIASHLAHQSQESELAFTFPELGEVSSTRFIKEGYRGLDMLDNVLERSFIRAEGELVVFLINTPEVPRLVTQLTAFLQEDGIDYQQHDLDGLNFYQVIDPYEGEWFFLAQNAHLIGVYAPLNEELQHALAAFVASTTVLRQ